MKTLLDCQLHFFNCVIHQRVKDGGCQDAERLVETASGLLNDITAVGALASEISERIKQEIGDRPYCDDPSDGARQLKAFTRKPKRLVTGKSVCENNDQGRQHHFYSHYDIICAGQDTDSCSNGANDLLCFSNLIG